MLHANLSQRLTVSCFLRYVFFLFFAVYPNTCFYKIYLYVFVLHRIPAVLFQSRLNECKLSQRGHTTNICSYIYAQCSMDHNSHHQSTIEYWASGTCMVVKGMQPGPRTSQRACMHACRMCADRCMHACVAGSSANHVPTHTAHGILHVIMLKKRAPLAHTALPNVNPSSSVSKLPLDFFLFSK
jgi:hypothetical protein